MGYSRKGVGGHCNGHGRGIHASLLVRLLCLSVCQSAAPHSAYKTAGWIKPGNWVSHKYSGVAESRSRNSGRGSSEQRREQGTSI